tara:strand:- start:790 stop:2379 length:1590 start_codon:yes stop_codon:yes gene_type:complete
MTLKKQLLLIVFLLSIVFVGHSQPLNSRIGLTPLKVEKSILQNQKNHSSVQPYRFDEAIINESINQSLVNLAFMPNWFSKQGKNGKSVYIQPYFEGLAFAGSGSLEYTAATGIDISGTLHKKLAFGLIYYRQFENDLPFLQSAHMGGFSPGLGTIQSVNNDVYQFNFLQAYLSYSPNNHFNFELGNGKQFIGEGYRSLLLSDNANNSPFLKLSVNFWNISYTSIWAYHYSIYSPNNVRLNLAKADYLGKYTASHYLDWNITKRFSIGLFETVVWQTDDSLYHRGFDVNYANPLLFYRPVEFSIGSPDNVMIGLNTKLRLFKHQYFYGQLLLDEFLLSEIRADVAEAISPDTSRKSGWWANKFGVQLGWKGYWEVAGGDLRSRVEYNLIRPYTYGHSSATQSYTNYGQSLAHTNGSNLEELITQLTFTKNRITLEGSFFYLRQGKSKDGLNYGDDLNVTNISHFQTYNNRLLQGERLDSKTISFDVAYRIKESSNLEVTLGYWGRSSSTQSENLISFGVRTMLNRRSREL